MSPSLGYRKNITQAKNATDQTTVQQWHELAAQWDSMANQAAKMLGGTSLWPTTPSGSWK
jgi:hypothetical protein